MFIFGLILGAVLGLAGGYFGATIIDAAIAGVKAFIAKITGK
jgi:hypothetical protein